MKKVERKIDVTFTKLDSYEIQDKRFLKVKIWLCHTGKNLNGSYFSKEAIEKAIPTLANTPILAFIEENSANELDFSDHRMELVVKDGEAQLKYLGQAIGVIPESNNAKFEMRICDDGVEREFLTCEALVWTKFDDPIDIFNRDGIKAQSMELDEEYEGFWREDNYFEFSNFAFYGACALGLEVLPAMRSASIEPNFQAAAFHREVQNQMQLFKLHFSDEGGHRMTIEELLAKYSMSKEDLAKAKIEYENKSLEDLEVEIKKYQEQQPSFSISASQLREMLRELLYNDSKLDDLGLERYRFWYYDHDDEKVIAYDEEDSYRLVGFKYKFDNGKVDIDFTSKKYVLLKYEMVDEPSNTFSDSQDLHQYKLKYTQKTLEKSFNQEKQKLIQDYTSDLNEYKNLNTELQSEVDELKNFKLSTLKEQRETAETEIVNKFSTELDESEVKSTIAAMHDKSVEEIEEKLFTLIGQKRAKFAASKSTNYTKASINPIIPEEKPFGGIIDKHNNMEDE